MTRITKDTWFKNPNFLPILFARLSFSFSDNLRTLGFILCRLGYFQPRKLPTHSGGADGFLRGLFQFRRC